MQDNVLRALGLQTSANLRGYATPLNISHKAVAVLRAYYIANPS